MNIYQENGYENRAHYLASLAESHGVDEDAVILLANLLGPSEDFDGLVSSIDDLAEGIWS